MKHPLLYISLLSAMFSSCLERNAVVNPSDYSSFMKASFNEGKYIATRDELNFWSRRILRDTGNFVDMLEMAAAHLHLFKIKGKVSDLYKGDSLLKRSAEKLNNSDADILFAISQSSITQHHFRDAAYYTSAAVNANGDPMKVCLLSFDAGMELGEYNNAEAKLERIKDKESFDYLIRKAKILDHQGESASSIRMMEKAFELVKNKKASLYCWALSNLADMYGHAGRVKESYNAYLDVLHKDSSYLYALKGIAWIAFSNDHNTTEAKRIIGFLQQQTSIPDLKLMLAEIAEWEGDQKLALAYQKKFENEITHGDYGDMYNKYLIELYCGNLNAPAKALLLALREINNRPTPETYSWLAWVYYSMNEKEKALQYVNGFVAGKTYEPSILLQTAIIYEANGMKIEAKRLFESCLEAGFELGPVRLSRVKSFLK